MTAALFNNQGGNFANVVDAYVYPQFIGYAQRAPNTQDIYNPGTRWQDNSVNPPVQYYTVGAGLWYQTANTAFGVSSVTGTANQITASPTTGNVILSIPATFVGPGSVGATTNLNAAGNLNLTGAASKININATTAASASVGTSDAMVAGVVTITTTAITASSKVYYSRRTLGTAMGNVSITAQSVGSVELTSDETTETSTFDYFIVN